MAYPTTVTLNDGSKISTIGLGTWQAEPNLVGNAVKHAIKSGYRHIDCAFVYQNESEVGEAIQQALKENDLKREDLFVTSKLWNNYHNPTRVEEAFHKSLTDLGLDYLDLYLIHWPFPSGIKYRADGSIDRFPVDSEGYPDVEKGYTLLDTWKVLEKLVDSGKVKSIGLSNFQIKDIKVILDGCRIKPVCNQVEMHPYLPQRELITYCKEQQIQVVAYSPLGSNFKPVLRENPLFHELAEKYKCQVAQILLSWALARGTVVIPKSVNFDRIEMNLKSVAIEKEDLDKIDNIGIHHRYNIPGKGVYDHEVYNLIE